MQTRRELLSHSVKVAGLLVAAGLLPAAAQAAWNEAAFSAKSLADVVKALGGGAPVESKDVTITGPDIAENGAVVPVGIKSNLPKTEMMALLVAKNPNALAGAYEILQGADAEVSMRIKMGETSEVVALVKADGKFYLARKEVKVTAGGCGG